MPPVPAPAVDQSRVRIDQDLCTGDGLCTQYASDVFELDVDGLAYVKSADGELQTAPGSAVPVPPHLLLRVIDSAEECPGDCIYVTNAAGLSVAGPDADGFAVPASAGAAAGASG
jgi:ferredoxin